MSNLPLSQGTIQELSTWFAPKPPPGQAHVLDRVPPSELAAIQAGTSTTDLSVIINAMAATLAESGGGALVFDPGTYPCYFQIHKPHRVDFIGRGLGNTFLDFHFADVANLAANPAAGIDFACCIAQVGAGATALPPLAEPVAKNALSLVFTLDGEGHTIEEMDIVHPGDVLKGHDPRPHSFSKYRPYYFAGEFFYVLDVIGDTVYLSRPTVAAYDEAHLNMYLCEFATGVIANMTILGKETSGTDPAILYYAYAAGLLLDNVKLHGSDFVHFLMQQCVAFGVRGVTARYYGAVGGTQYGGNINNSQDGWVENCDISVSRHAITHGGSHAEGVPTRGVQLIGCRLEGRGPNTVGAVGYHANTEGNLILSCIIFNGVTWAGTKNAILDTHIYSGYANVLVGGSEFVSPDNTLDGVYLHVMQELLSDSGSQQGAIHLTQMPSMEMAGTWKLHNIIVDMNGYHGEPLECYSISEAPINWDVHNFKVINADRTLGSSLMIWDCGAGHKLGQMFWSDCASDGVDWRLNGVGPKLARWVNHVALNPSSNGITVLQNSLRQSTFQTRATEGGVKKVLEVSYDENGNQILEDHDFTLEQDDGFYAAYTVPWSNIHFTFATVNNNAGTIVWQYVSAAPVWDDVTQTWGDPTWTNFAGVVDNTVLSGAPFGRPIDDLNDATDDALSVSWTLPAPGAWVKSYVLGEDRDHAYAYWIRGVLTTATTLDPVTITTVETRSVPQPVTEEAFEIFTSKTNGANAAGYLIDGTSQAFSTLRIVDSDLTDNGSVISPTSPSSAKTSIHMNHLKSAELPGTWLGDSRVPAGHTVISSDPYAMTLYNALNISRLDVRTIKNINPAGLTAVNETSVTRYYPAARAYRTASATPANATWTNLALALESFDGDTLHDASGIVVSDTRITARERGQYLLVGTVSFANNTTGSRGVRIRVNGATVICQTVVGAAQGSDTTDLTVTGIWQLAPGDYVELQAYQTSGAGLALNVPAAWSTSLQAIRIV